MGDKGESVQLVVKGTSKIIERKQHGQTIGIV